MKTLFACLFLPLLLAGSFLHAAEKWLPPPDKRWMLKLEPALEKAKKENKFVYVLQTGSDWCSWCIDLEERVLSQKLFTDFAKKHLILVYLDFPTAKIPMPQEQRSYNQALRKKLNFGNGYPAAKILDANGKELFEADGYCRENIYISRLYKNLRLPNAPVFPAAGKCTLTSPKGKPVNVSVEITAWGTSPDKVDRPFSAVEEIKIAPRTRIFFKLRYQLPGKFRAALNITGMDDMRIGRNKGKKIDQSGTYLVSTILPDRLGMWQGIRCAVMPVDHNYTAKFILFDCSIQVTDQLLSQAEKNARNQRVAAYNELYGKSKFKIVKWGYSRKSINRPFVPGKTIKVKKGQDLHFKIRYQLPGKRPSVIWVESPRGYSHSASGMEAVSGEITRSVSCLAPGTRSHLLVTLRPKGLETMKYIIRIPCRVVWE